MIIEIKPLFKNLIELVQAQYSNTAKPVWINVNNISDIEQKELFHEERTIDQVYGLIIERKKFNYYILKMSSGTEIPIDEEELNKIMNAQKK